MRYKTIVYKPTGVCMSRAFSLLRDAKIHARRISAPGDNVRIEEHWEDEQNTLYKYTVEGWLDKDA